MEIKAESEVLLREAGYRTSTWLDDGTPVLRFEDLSVFGFLFTFASVQQLLEQHEVVEQRALSAHALALKASGVKAWNVYSVFLTPESARSPIERSVLRVEEDLRRTRKIARTGISSSSDLRTSLLALLPIMSQPELRATNYISRLDDRIKRIASGGTAEAFLSDSPAHDLARMLLEQQ